LRTRAGTPGFDARGYHKGDYSSPRSREELFEIVVGAILTQNTTWKNAEKSIEQLHREQMISPASLASADLQDLTCLIHSSGYYNQKAKKLRIISRYFLEEKRTDNKYIPGRNELLSLWGIGPETADSILLYAFGEPFFVVDAYTKRLLTRLGHISGKESYDDIQKLCTRKDNESDSLHQIHYFNEYHALIVEHAKQHCQKKPVCSGCPVKKYCQFM
jgi:endonuclease III related protein